MKLSELISYHYIVYVAIALMMSSGKLVKPVFHKKIASIEEVKVEAFAYHNADEMLHGQLLYRY